MKRMRVHYGVFATLALVNLAASQNSVVRSWSWSSSYAVMTGSTFRASAAAGEQFAGSLQGSTVAAAAGFAPTTVNKGSSTGVQDPPEVTPARFSLSQNYPNPFNPTTTIRFDIPRPAHVVLRVFNILGQEVARLADGRFSSGAHYVTFDAKGLPSGVYVYRIHSRPEDGGTTHSAIKRLVLLK